MGNQQINWKQGRVKACAKCAAAQGPPKVKGPPRIEKLKNRGSEIYKKRLATGLKTFY